MSRRTIARIETLSAESQALYDALKDEREIACVLLSASFVDKCLASLLAGYLVKSEVTDKLLDPGDGLLGSFAARSDLAYCLGLVAKPVYQNLMLLGRIRNRFAHSHVAVGFDDEEVAAWCLELQYPPFVPCPVDLDGDAGGDALSICTDPRERFTVVTTLLVHRLVLTAMEVSHRQGKDEWWS